MQNLFLKFVVLTGVIGGSCFVVWLANENLHKAPSVTDPNQFAAIESEEDPTDVVEDLRFDDNSSDVVLRGTLPTENEIVPTPATQPADPEPTIAKPLSFQPSSSAQFAMDDAAKHRELSRISENRSPPATEEISSPSRSSASGPGRFPSPAGNTSSSSIDETRPSAPVMPLSFYPAGGGIDVPSVVMSFDDANNATPAASSIPLAEVANTGASPGGNLESPEDSAAVLPSQIENPELAENLNSTPKPSFLRFGPSTKSTEDQSIVPAPASFATNTPPRVDEPVLPNEPVQPNESELASGLTKLPATHPGPLLLPPSALPTLGMRTETNEETDSTLPQRSRSGVVTADAREFDDQPIAHASGDAENPFARFKSISPAANSTLPDQPVSNSGGSSSEENPFARFQPRAGSTPAPVKTAELEPVVPSDLGFNTPPPQPSVPAVSEDPFSRNNNVQQNDRLLSQRETRDSTENQPVPEELLPPLDFTRMSSSGVPAPALVSSPPTLAPAPTNFESTSEAVSDPVLPRLNEPSPLPAFNPSTANSDQFHSGTIREEASVFPRDPALSAPGFSNATPPSEPDRNSFPVESTAPSIAASPMPLVTPAVTSRTPELVIPPPLNPNREAPVAMSIEPAPLRVESRVSNDFERGQEFEGGQPAVGSFGPLAHTPERTSGQPIIDESVMPSQFSLEPTPVPASTGNPTANASLFPSQFDSPQPLADSQSHSSSRTLSTSPSPANELTGTGTIDPSIASGPQSPELKIEKIAPASASIGEPLIYAIRIRNVGGSDARSVVVEDRIPRGTRLEGTIPQAVLTNDKLSWDLGRIPPGEERTIQLKVIPTQAGDIGSVATVSFEAAVAATIRVTAPELSVDIEGPTETLLGKNVPYKFTVRNTGQGAARDVVLRAILPPSLTHPNGNDIEADLETIPPGESRTVDLVVVADQVGVSTPKVLVWMGGKDVAQNRADLRILESRIRLARTGPQRRFVGRAARFETQVTNDSSITLTNVSVVEQLPVSVDLATFVNGWDPQRRVIQRTIPILKPGETQQFITQIIPNQAGEVVGKLVVQDAAGNRADLETPLSVKGFADLEANIRGDNKVVAIGDQVSFRLNLKNDGTAAANNVQAAFEIPRGLTFATASGPGTYRIVENQILFDTLEEMPTQSEKQYDIVLTAVEVCNTKVKVALHSAEYEQPINLEEPVRVISDGP